MGFRLSLMEDVPNRSHNIEFLARNKISHRQSMLF